jgi:hypothetical protein
MKDFVDKIESYLFDFLGLFIPGLLTISMLIIPSFMIDFSKLLKINNSESKILSFIMILYQNVHNKDINFLRETYSIILIVLALYILGHLIKVLAITFYEISVAFFDLTINKIIIHYYFKILNKLRNHYKEKYENNKKYKSREKMKFIYNWLVKFTKPYKNLLNKIFVFKPDDYLNDNEPLKSRSIKLINVKTGMDYPDIWYSIFKFSNIINTQENIKSLSFTFLSKYNLYRSLSFIFFVSFFYYSIFFNVAESYIYSDVLILKGYMLFIIVLLWFTFHYKFKRYWTLCGNETLVSIFYFLNKNKINAR